MSNNVLAKTPLQFVFSKSEIRNNSSFCNKKIAEKSTANFV